jgi:type II secretion system protein G
MKPIQALQRGFTLIELLVVVVIIGILASVAVPNFMGAQDKAKNAGVQSNSHNVQMALEQYAVDKAGVYPANETNLLTEVIQDAGYMAAGGFPKTPWGGQQAVGIANGATYVGTYATLVGTATLGAGAGPPAVIAQTNYGAIAYNVPSGTGVSDRYNLVGTGKKGVNATIAVYLKNY